ncbi:hypothetical protein MY494_07400 [Synechococcus sp. A10-1-5-1]|uniref:hypothetical protein n=1 Tax=Synechococcus sp. A10-1-5-1 TaxID=2936507 RepID=UPI0020011178|nr:hypothetical protein [Synechococcus sp. A10-1-5-1]UPM49179.1 hypothetical protein MY494_07400 [Synechococcus sp. A10-1-5-1]
MPDIKLVIPLAPGVSIPTSLQPPASFDHSIQQLLNYQLTRIKFIEDCSLDEATELLSSADFILKHIESDEDINRRVLYSKKTCFRVDPFKVRQEGSFYIQCAFECVANIDQLINESKRKFCRLIDELKGKPKAWVLATGPSLEQYANHDYSESVVIACNSTILNDELMDLCKPSLLVFADPIFHFGVSQYAAKFRAAVLDCLTTTNLKIVVPLKYYPLLLSLFPDYTERIIGIPTTKNTQFNIDIAKSFCLKNTSNILTLLLLPLATTLSKDVNLTGCDGRPFEQDDYFWGHSKAAQINDKMSNIKSVHPGFFQIDYNEYYFEHCHTLSNFFDQAENLGWKFFHHGHSYIPALRDRSQSTLALTPQAKPTCCLVLEPDGIGLDGHYVRWHNNLIPELQKKFAQVDVLCNRKQDPDLYVCTAHAVLTSFSWSLSRAPYCFDRDFAKHINYQRFINEIISTIESIYQSLPEELNLFLYYGSVQILKALQLARDKLRKVGVNLKVVLCLFHESVILDNTRTVPIFPPGSREILFEGAAQIDSFRLTCVGGKLSEYVFEKQGTLLPVFPNPPPSLSDSRAEVNLKLSSGSPKDKAPNYDQTILLPTNPRDEKGGYIIEQFLEYLHAHGTKSYRYLVRGEPKAGATPRPHLVYLGSNISDDEYAQAMMESDIVFIPYPPPAFTYRTSGILPEALTHLKSLIVLDGTWLSDVVRETASGIAIKYRSPLSILSAINALSTKSDELSRIQERRTKVYLLSNSWSCIANLASF